VVLKGHLKSRSNDMIKRIAFVAALAGIAVLPLAAGCGGNGNSGFTEEPLRVLQLGDRWVMNGTRTGGVNESYTDTVEVKTATLNGQTYSMLGHTVQPQGDGAPIVDGDLFTQSNSSRDLVQVGELDDDGEIHATTPHVMVPGQLRLGQSWTVNHDEDGDLHRTTFTVVGFEHLETAVGRHLAAKLAVSTVADNSAHSASGTAWFEPGLGYFLKTVSTHQEGEATITTTETIASTTVDHDED